jgi:hypothetical protein
MRYIALWIIGLIVVGVASYWFMWAAKQKRRGYACEALFAGGPPVRSNRPC